VFFNPRDRAELAAFLRTVPLDVPSTSSASAATCWCVMGSQGIVVSTHGTLDVLTRIDETTVHAQAGIACARIRQAMRQVGSGARGILRRHSRDPGAAPWR